MIDLGVIDYIWLLIGVAISAIFLLITYLIEINLRRARRERFEFTLEASENCIGTTNKDENTPKYDDESMKVIEALESLSPFNHPFRGYIEFRVENYILQYRDIVRPKYYGIQGNHLVRQRRYVTWPNGQCCNTPPEWTDIGPVKKEL